MRLAAVVETSRRITETPKRLEKIALLTALLRQLTPEELEITTAFLSGHTRQGRIGIGYAAVRQASTMPSENPTLEIADLDRAFQSISETKGRKAEALGALLARATGDEQQFIQALLLGELRQGALLGIMLEAVAKAFDAPVDRVRHATMVAGDLVPVARTLAETGPAGLDRFEIQLFRPVLPMLAQTSDDVEDALADLGEAALEFKLDGARVQVHKSGDQVAVFSRRMNDVTAAVPEIVETVRGFPAKDFILDGEVISLKPDGSPQPFQITMRRFGRKLDVDRMREELPLSAFWFDVLHLDSGNLIHEPQSTRFAQLQRLAPGDMVIPHAVVSDPRTAGEFLEESLRRGHEGIMVKSLSGSYVAGARGEAWRKVKHVHTLDLVVLAAEWGSGRRKGWLSNLHLGARDTEKGGYAMLGKTFKGLTDEMLAWQTQEFLKLEIAKDNYTVYIEPKIVVEIAFNDVQVSPHYPSGLALRFARVKRYRPDKDAAQAATLREVAALAPAV